MMAITRSLTPRVRRLAMMAIAGGSVVAAARVGVDWTRDVTTRARQAADTRRMLEREWNALDADLTRVPTRRDLPDSLEALAIGGGTPEEAAAELALTVRQVFTAANAAVERIEMVADSAYRDGVVPVGVRIAGSGSSGALIEILAALESDAPLLRVNRLRVTQGDPGAADSSPERLQLDMEVIAFTLHPNLK